MRAHGVVDVTAWSVNVVGPGKTQQSLRANPLRYRYRGTVWAIARARFSRERRRHWVSMQIAADDPAGTVVPHTWCLLIHQCAVNTSRTIHLYRAKVSYVFTVFWSPANHDEKIIEKTCLASCGFYRVDYVPEEAEDLVGLFVPSAAWANFGRKREGRRHRLRSCCPVGPAWDGRD